MKTIRAKGAMVMGIGLFGGCSLGLIWWGGWMFWEGDIKEGVAMLVLSFVLILIGTLYGTGAGRTFLLHLRKKRDQISRHESEI